MQFDTALNLIWLCLGAAMLGWTVYRSKQLGVEHRASWLQIVGVMAIALALFPYVSATDDLVWLEDSGANTEHGSNRSSQNGSSRALVDLLHAAEASTVANIVRMSCTLVFFAFLLVPVFRINGRSREYLPGRSPPLYSSL